MISAGRTRTLGVAVVGAGHWGPNLLRNFHEDPRSHVAWVIDQSEAARDRVQHRYPTIPCHDDLAVALADPAVGAVVVATPARSHAAIATAVLQAGKHCLVEKPLTTDVGSAQALVELAEAKHCVLAVGHVFLYNPAIRLAKTYIADGRLGRPYYASMVRTNLGPPEIDVDVAWDLATHDVSITNYWFEAAPLSASALGGRWMQPGRVDTIFATLTYPNDCMVHITASWLSPRKMREITLVGSRLMAVIDDMNVAEPVRIHDKGIDPEGDVPFVDTVDAFRASIRDGGVHSPCVSLGEPLRGECGHFLDCILDGSTPVASGRSALAVVATVEAINRSAAHGGREEAVRLR